MNTQEADYVLSGQGSDNYVIGLAIREMRKNTRIGSDTNHGTDTDSRLAARACLRRIVRDPKQAEECASIMTGRLFNSCDKLRELEQVMRRVTARSNTSTRRKNPRYVSVLLELYKRGVWQRWDSETRFRVRAGLDRMLTGHPHVIQHGERIGLKPVIHQESSAVCIFFPVEIIRNARSVSIQWYSIDVRDNKSVTERIMSMMTEHTFASGGWNDTGNGRVHHQR